jgi:hypothetical protein
MIYYNSLYEAFQGGFNSNTRSVEKFFVNYTSEVKDSGYYNIAIRTYIYLGDKGENIIMARICFS